MLMKSHTDVATLVIYGGEVELKCTSVITWALFMYCDIACRELIYAGLQLLCIIQHVSKRMTQFQISISNNENVL